MAPLRTVLSHLTLTILLFIFCEGEEILVGGKDNSWKVPESSSKTLNDWAVEIRFKVGDWLSKVQNSHRFIFVIPFIFCSNTNILQFSFSYLVWTYDAKVDSVLQVTKEDYETCNKSKPMKEYHSGNDKIELSQSGPFFFISGAEGHCEKGQKLIVTVMSIKHSSEMKFPAPAPAPAIKTNGALGLDEVSVGRMLLLGFVLLMGLIYME